MTGWKYYRRGAHYSLLSSALTKNSHDEKKCAVTVPGWPGGRPDMHHDGMRYDLTVDTTAAEPGTAAAKVATAIHSGRMQ